MPAILFFAIFLVGKDVGHRAQRANSTSIGRTFDHDVGDQWMKNLTNLEHQRTKFAVVVLMREEDLVTRRWMGEGGAKNTTIFLLSDGMNVNSLQKVSGNVYGVTVQSNMTRDAGDCNFLS